MSTGTPLPSDPAPPRIPLTSRTTARPLPEEMAQARQWVSARFAGLSGPDGIGPAGSSTAPLFSFVYGGQPSAEWLAGWPVSRQSTDLDEHRVQHTLTWRDPGSGLGVRCAGVAWKAYPIVEWTVHLRNDGSADTPIIESLQTIDTVFQRGPEGEFLLHYHRGDDCTIDSFAPREAVLGPHAAVAFVAARGRPTSEAWPYYNLELPVEERGVLVVVGWPGQWAASFRRDAETGLRVCAGQELTRFCLHPGEAVRTPLVVVQFYRGGGRRAQNLWRRWMFDHNLPLDHGQPLAPKVGAASVQYDRFVSTQAGDLHFIQTFLDKGIALDYWWMDAGWYTTDGAGWPKVGTWEVDPGRFPGGLRPIADLCHAHGVQLLVWFEVERVHADTWLARHHPEWIHGGAQGGLLKMDEPEAVRCGMSADHLHGF